MATTFLTDKQYLKIKSLIMDTNNHLNKEFTSGFCLIDIFSNHFSFTSVSHKNTKALVAYQNRLDNVYKNSLINQDTIFIIVNASIDNNIAFLISHIHRGQEIITKSIYYVMNITSTKAELFDIRCNINHAN